MSSPIAEAQANGDTEHRFAQPGVSRFRPAAFP